MKWVSGVLCKKISLPMHSFDTLFSDQLFCVQNTGMDGLSHGSVWWFVTLHPHFLHCLPCTTVTCVNRFMSDYLICIYNNFHAQNYLFLIFKIYISKIVTWFVKYDWQIVKKIFNIKNKEFGKIICHSHYVFLNNHDGLLYVTVLCSTFL